ncbi:hypothetical protein Taro_044194 [Colocasia esculenta]|uniref:BHLH domain-containing protein n=1 Tax=Colocasia esculenta TaxID=4460 RepID=A0A843WTE3_COLES|nr:hypothetical protein [Colocasia esculenta]
MDDAQALSDLFDDSEFGHDDWAGAASPDNLFIMLQSLEEGGDHSTPLTPLEEVFSPRGSSTTALAPAGAGAPGGLVTPRSASPASCTQPQAVDADLEGSGKRKRLKTADGAVVAAADPAAAGDGQIRISHIAVERNRRKQMNEHLAVLRSLMPCFYVKRGDQASIIGGVVDYIKELQQVLQSLEAKKQRKVYSEVLSPRPVVSSPRPSALSPRPPPPSPRINLPISPRTPQPGSPYKPKMQQPYVSPAVSSSLEPSPTLDSASDLAANSKSPLADVEVKLSGPNVLLKTISPRIPGQAFKIIAALERLALEILHVKINTVDDTMLNSFTIKV